MQRPLLQHGVGQLEALFASSKTNLKVLKQLEHELQFRQVPRALALLEQVQAAIPDADSIPAPRASGSVLASQSDLRNHLPVASSPSPSMQRPSAQLVEQVSCPAITVTPRPALTMTVDDACKVLNVSLASQWQDVERARRQLVQLSHPERIATMTPERRSQVRVEANRVNAAYAVLSAAKVR